MKSFLFLTLLVTSHLHAGILPDIFYREVSDQKTFCESSPAQTENFWRTLMGNHIEARVGHRPQVVQNSFVSLSYLEIFKLPSRYAPAKFMGYVYGNASHHLGRIIRFKEWPSDHPLKKDDQKLVKGMALRVAAETTSHELSKRLMHHSLELYKELSWSLGLASLCGKDLALKIVKDENLKKAFESDSIGKFIEPFVTYEQTHLQKVMYSELIIGTAAKAKVLDEMRFISFNGEEQLSFHKWCFLTHCETSSYDLRNRIRFDVTAVNNELKLLMRRFESLSKRAKRARIEETAAVFMKDL